MPIKPASIFHSAAAFENAPAGMTLIVLSSSKLINLDFAAAVFLFE